ncbi:START domain-containing protein [Ferrimonas marina]|uniref:Polyketide cyclase / dehydrase and lipid transport n=1 Tax=Ferrimonas marina TaxID=299255 RepID=A0A1M5X9H5_9GAMM|nr:START domain-containing protein [Ferrimonas marina]SHH96312.1 Polyketide cyclase / dehydrase and lipid transport [Ferrimonas marina]
MVRAITLLLAGLMWLAPVQAERIAPAPGDDWQRASRKGDNSVWTREVPGTAVKEVKLEAVIDAPVEQVWRTIAEIEAYPDFMPYIDAIEVVGSDEDGELVYHRVSPPLVSKRDYTLLIVNEEDPEQGQYYRYWTPRNEQGPEPRSGVVRLEICDGSWALSRREDGRTQATYWVYTDPGGSIPAWLANRANTVGLYDILKAVERRAQDLSWQQEGND